MHNGRQQYTNGAGVTFNMSSATDFLDDSLDESSTLPGNQQVDPKFAEIDKQFGLRVKIHKLIEIQIHNSLMICRKTDKISQDEVFRLQAIRDSLKYQHTKFMSCSDEILSLIPVDQCEQEATFQAQAESAIRSTIVEIETVISNFNDSNELSGSHQMTGMSNPMPPMPYNPSFKLPSVQIKEFTGNYMDWTSFYDLFTASVDNNSSLSGAEKLYYLKSLVTGEPSKLIASFQLTNSNYQLAFDTLKERYSNKKLIIRSHVKALQSMNSLQNENGQQLRRVSENFKENIQCLRNLCSEEELLDALLVFQLTDKLDPDTRKAWELETSSDKNQTYEKLQTFIQNRASALEASAKPRAPVSVSTAKQALPAKSFVAESQKLDPNNQASPACIMNCADSHRLHNCPKFVKLTLDERQNIVKGKRLCFNCLTFGHSVKECKSKHKCRECNSFHHTLLHRQPNKQQPSSKAHYTDDSEEPVSASNHASFNSNPKEPEKFEENVVMETAMVPVKTNFGQVPCRAFLDTGSNRCFITSACVRRLKLGYKHALIPIGGIGATANCTSLGYLDITLCPQFFKEIRITALVVDKLTNPMPTKTFSMPSFSAIHQVKLADPAFNQRASIDLLLGSNILQDLYLDNRIKIHRTLSLVETKFGYVVSGCLKPPNDLQEQSSDRATPSALYANSMSFKVNVDHGLTTKQELDEKLNDQVERFWKLEEFPAQKRLKPEEQFCQDHYDQTTVRQNDGRFQVDMPFKPESPKLGNSFQQALRRFHLLEKRLNSNPDLRDGYNKFIQEFLDLKHLEIVPREEIEKKDEEVFYLPHHCVFKESTTTKLRVVFDGSAKTSSGVSLNEILAVGPKIQDELYEILLRFRTHPIALSADVAKMYRQIALSNPAKDYHRILWRFSPNEPIQTYRMNRVTYGIASSSYHSIRSLQECSQGAPEPIVTIIVHDFNVDDYLGGCDNVEEGIQIQDGLNTAFASGGMELRKWSSSNSELVMRLPENLRENADAYMFKDDSHMIKTLGIIWHPASDNFAFKVTKEKIVNTKRGLLSDTAKLFDPIGWLGPLIIKFKILIQKSWQANIKWDSKLPDYISNEWMNARDDLQALNQLLIPRCIVHQNYQRVSIHVFCNASEAAYAACLYLRVEYPDRVEANLLTAKTRVAPVKQHSLPRLELCAAYLGSQIVRATMKALATRKFDIASVNAWSDSTIVLA